MADLQNFSLRKAVQFAITTEQVGARAYRRLAHNLESDGEIAALFLDLAADEERHEAEFRAIMESLPERDAPRNYSERYGVLRAMSISEFFSPRSGLTRDVDQIRTRENALRRAVELEKATLGYYQALRDVMEPSDALDEIIRAERRHLLRVSESLDQGE
jgi:rubrerythrin